MIKIPINRPTKIELPNFKRKRKDKKANPNTWYIYKTELLLAAMFYKAAGGVGRIILDYLLWKRSMNGIEETTLPNEFFYLKYGITRQRKSAALLKLQRAELVSVFKEPGKAIRVKLTTREKKNGKEN